MRHPTDYLADAFGDDTEARARFMGQPADEDYFGIWYAFLAVAFDKPVNPERQLLYFRALADFGFRNGDLREAGEHILKVCHTFPAVADFAKADTRWRRGRELC